MRVIIVVILAVFLFTLTAYPQLTDDNSKIKAEMTAIELQLTQQIQESENRLRSELNEQLNTRIHDFTIVFGIISGGFFLLFAAVLLINALRNRPIVDNKTNAALILATISGILYLTSTAIAYEGDKRFGHITCTGITMIDKDNKMRALLLAEPYPSISLYNQKNKEVATLSGSMFGGTLILDSDNPPTENDTRVSIAAASPGAYIHIGEAKPVNQANGIMLGASEVIQAITVKHKGNEHYIYPDWLNE